MPILLTVWSFLKSPIGRYLAATVGVVLVLALAYHVAFSNGVKHQLALDTKAEAAAKANVAAHEVKAAAISTTAKADLVKTQTVIQTRTVTLLKEVPTYVTAKDDAACAVPPGFVSLWNRGESGEAGLAGRPGGYDSALAGLQPPAVQP